MKISRSWLSDFVDLSGISVEELAELLTTRVAELEGIEPSGTPLEKGRVCIVKSVMQHPKRPSLKVVRISTGDGETEVCCGAPNCREGLVTAYLPPGAVVMTPEGKISVEERTIDGVVSKGVLASERELDVCGDHSGVVEIPAGTKLGEGLESVFGPVDWVLSIDNKSLTHRPDLWSHFGFARELSAILKRPFKINADRWSDANSEGRKLLDELRKEKPAIEVIIDPATKCRRFLGIELNNVTVQPSPVWVRRRLAAVGAGVRNLLVDLSNYVMHDIGQPNHVFDRDTFTDTKLDVRLARPGEKFQGLDGVEYTLSPNDVVVGMGQEAESLGGILGGARTAVTESTKRLFFEAANWDPVLIRLTAKRHAVRTDASNRFEKSQSQYLPPLALHRYVELLHKIAPNVAVASGLTDNFREAPQPISIRTSFSYIRERLGTALDEAAIGAILEGLQFKLGAAQDGTFEAHVPYYRATRDISIPDDLVEEVGRIHGYENIPEAAPQIVSSTPEKDDLRELEFTIRDMLRGVGFSEHSGYSFACVSRARALGYASEAAIRIENPVDSEADELRVSLIPGLIEAIERNAKTAERFGLFELGRTYRVWGSEGAQDAARFQNQPADEERMLALGYVSGVDEAELTSHTVPPLLQGGDFYAVIGVLRRVARLVSAEPLKLQPSLEPRCWMHPYRNAEIFLKDKLLGVVAEAWPGTVDGLRTRAILAEVRIETLLELGDGAVQFCPIARFPDSFFEMSIVMPESEPYRELEKLIEKNVTADRLRRLEVLQVYRGAPLKAGEKSVSIKLYLGADDRTLSHEELTILQAGLMSAVKASSYTLRG